MFKERPWLAGVIAFVLAIITLTSSIAVKTINKMAPWFILLIIFGILILIVFQAMGISETKINDVLTGEAYGPAFTWWIIALVLIIGLGSLAFVISEEEGFLDLTAQEAGEEETGFWATLVHPKILGLVLLFLVAYFAVGKLTSTK